MPQTRLNPALQIFNRFIRLATWAKIKKLRGDVNKAHARLRDNAPRLLFPAQGYVELQVSAVVDDGDFFSDPASVGLCFQNRIRPLRRDKQGCRPIANTQAKAQDGRYRGRRLVIDGVVDSLPQWWYSENQRLQAFLKSINQPFP